MLNKYELVMDDYITCYDSRLYRIRALKDFSDVKAGDLGGWVSGEHNLSHEGDCWVYDDARIIGNAKVIENAKAYNNANICGNALIRDNVSVSNNAIVAHDSVVRGYAFIYNNAKILENARISGTGMIYNYAMVCGYTEVSGSVNICDCAIVRGGVISGNNDNVEICGNTEFGPNARITDNSDYLCIKGLGSANRFMTVYRTEDKNVISVICGCFEGTLDAFVDKIFETHGYNTKYAKEYLALINVIKIHFEL